MRHAAALALVLTLALGGLPGCAAPPAPERTPQPAPAPRPSQNPSPMVEHTRAHPRLQPGEWVGERVVLDAGLPRPVELFLPPRVDTLAAPALLVHFMGAAYVPARAVAALEEPYLLALVQLGAGSGAYERPMSAPGAFARLLQAVRAEAGRRAGREARFRRVEVSAFSAGYGAVRAILAQEENHALLDGVLLLDALHTGYLPEGRPLAEGGALDTARLAPFVSWARRAASGEKRFLLTHSEVFPGTFASTTEAADHLLQALGLRRTPVLRWGPAGMQQLSEAARGGLRVLGFAGNSAPDHLDHLHGMVGFLPMLGGGRLKG